MTWDKGKGFDTFGPIGPFILTRDEIGDFQNLNMFLDVNGKRMQTGNTKEMIFDIKKSVQGVRDHDTYKEDGLYNVEKIVVESSNIGTAQIALKIGKDFQKDFLDKLGFFKKIDVESFETVARFFYDVDDSICRI